METIGFYYDPDAIASRIREELMSLYATPAEAAKAFRCSRQVVSSWLCGRNLPTAYYLGVMSKAGCDIAYILTGEWEEATL